MTVQITYFVHGTTTDNEKNISTGALPGKLSLLGIEQSKRLKEQIKEKKFDMIFCSDSKRAIDSAHLVFEDDVQIIQDKRICECNYGDLNGAPSSQVEPFALDHLTKPFPNGESYANVETRIRSFLKDLQLHYSGKRVGIVAHKAPQLAIEVIVNKKTWEQAVKEDWRLKQPKEWKPGWDYTLEKLD